MDNAQIWDFENNEPNVGYDGIVELFGDIIAEYTLGSYQGEYVYVIRNHDTPDYFAYLSLSFGSCSLCDFLQGCDDLNELQDYINSINPNWQSAEDLAQWLVSHDWHGDYMGWEIRQEQKRWDDFILSTVSILLGK